MKKLLLIIVIIAGMLSGNAAVRTWAGGAMSNWNNAGNWSGATVPIAGDDVIFNSSATVIIDLGLSPISLNSLHFINNSTVTFQNGETSNFRLVSTTTANPALLIEAGCIFTFDGINTGINNSTLDMTFGAGCIGSISGTLNISGTGGASTGPKLDTYNSATNYGIVTVASGGIIRILPGADNTESSITPVPTIIMQNGSVYENLKNGGSFPEGSWSPNSLARALGSGTIGPSFNGTTYGNLEWNCMGQMAAAFLTRNVSFNNVNFISTHKAAINGNFTVKTGSVSGVNIMRINGDLDVGTDARLVTSSGSVLAGSNGGYIAVSGNINNQGTITSNGVTGTLNDLIVTGITAQTFANTGVFAGTNLLFSMTNPAGLTLLTPLTLPWNAEFTDGKIYTTAINLLTMTDNATYTGGSVNSFIEGPLQKIGDEDFVFPVGAGSIFAPIGMAGGTGLTTDVFTAEYKRTNPQSIHGTVVQPGLNHVSYVECWKLNQNSGTSTKKVSLKVNTTSFCQVLANTFVSRWNGSLWTNEGSIVSGFMSIPPFETGTLTSPATLSTFGDFTLATDLTYTANALPLQLVSFNAQSLNSAMAILNWELAAPCSGAVQFEVEKSAGQIIFTSVGKLPGSVTNRFYSLPDNNLEKGTTYYRLKMTDEQGKISYSNFSVVINAEKGILITNCWPNPVKQNAMLTLAAAKAGLAQLVITDNSGNPVKRWEISAVNGNNNIPLVLDGLPAGVYYVLVYMNSERSVFRLVKQ